MPTTAADLGLVAPDAPASSAESLGLKPPSPPGPGPSTTAGGLAASAARGAAPYAAGAGVGAAIGAPFAGVGAIPGAIAGMGAVGLTQLGEDIYNWVGNKGFGLPRATTPQDAMDRVLDQLGIKRPATGLERMAESTAGLLPFGVSPTGVLSKAIADNSAEGVDRFIRNQYIRSIKPSEGKAGASQWREHMDSARSAVDQIVENKANLRYGDEFGQTAGHLPKTIEQFSDAIEQTKAGVFAKYDAMARAAGDAGARVSLQSPVSELEKIARDPVVIDLHPEVAKYAESQAARLSERGSYSAPDAQRAVQNLNVTLKAFYKNPTYENATRASVDAMVANQLRGELDRTIETATGPGYQMLKNAYGDLKTIEKEVIHRAIVEGRKNAGGGLMGNIGDIASADQVIHGVLTFSPGTIARGTLLKGFQTFVRHLRDPNRAVERIFDAAEQQQKVREMARAGLPTYRDQPLLKLPPPEVAGGSPWIGTGQGVFPGRSGFTMQNPNPSLYEKGR